MNRESTELQLFRAILDHSFDAIIVADQDLKITYWSQSASRMFGFSNDEVIKRDFNELLVPVRHKEKSLRLFDRIRESESSGAIARVIEIEALTKSGQEIWVALTLTTVFIDDAPWTIAILRDVGERKLDEERLRVAAATDSLSGLANRAEFQRKLESSLGTSIALAIIDVDNFKSINDLFGHLAGDSAIEIVSKAISQKFADAVCVSRFGGDEFGVIVEANSKDAVQQHFEELRVKISQITFLDGAIEINVSIGVTCGQEGDSARSLLGRADKLLYQAKHDGRNQVCSD